MGSAVSNGNCSSVPATSTGAAIVRHAKDIMAGKAITPWTGGAVPYSWGGGHQRTAVGPSFGTCVGYKGPLPCRAPSVKGVDCSGFTRWVYKLAYGTDVLGGVNSNGQLARMEKTTSPQPGDLVFFGASTIATTHVAVYIGSGRMIEAPHTGAYIRESAVASHPKLVGYYRY
jgi:cell wall-associated NlpC family hydrolase